jgi:hypothetical protein
LRISGVFDKLRMMKEVGICFCTIVVKTSRFSSLDRFQYLLRDERVDVAKHGVCVVFEKCYFEFLWGFRGFAGNNVYCGVDHCVCMRFCKGELF